MFYANNSQALDLKLSKVYLYYLDADTLHGGEYVDADTLHGGEYVDADTLHGGEYVDADTLHGGEYVDADTLHGGEYVDADTLHSWRSYTSAKGRSYNYAFVKRPDGHIDVAIQTPPTGRSEDLHVVHKLPLEGNSQGVKKICVQSDKQHIFNTPDKAHGLMREYVNMYDEYIDSGRTIDEQLGR